MKVVENKLAEDILKLYVPKNILTLKPIIAGGFIASLYRNIIKRSEPSFDYELSKILEEKSQSSKFSMQLKKLIGSKNLDDKALNFGDIDLWFYKNNEIWNESHPAHFFISYLEPDPPKATFNGRLPVNELKLYYEVAKKLKPSLEAFDLSYNHGIRTSSGWANTFYIRNNDFDLSCPIQMIKKPQENVDQLLSSFDIINCCAAYHDGKFYFADGFEEAFSRGYLEKGNSYNKKHVQDKIWGANRAFKYAKRYDLEFSKEICEEMVRLFIDAEEFINNLNKGIEEDQVVKTTEVDFEDPYGRIMTKISKETILSIANTMLSKFPELILMKHFDKDYIFLFLSSKDPGIMYEVQKYIELQEKLLRGETEAKEVSWNEHYNGFF